MATGFPAADTMLDPERVDDLRARVAKELPLIGSHGEDVERFRLLREMPALVTSFSNRERAAFVVRSIPPPAMTSRAVGDGEGLNLWPDRALHVIEQRLDSFRLNA